MTGRLVRPDERFAQALTWARYAEQFGYDAVALGERPAGEFLSSGVGVLLGAIAASTSRVRIQTGVSVLSIHDPLRIAEDYAIIDQLSRVWHGSAARLCSDRGGIPLSGRHDPGGP